MDKKSARAYVNRAFAARQMQDYEQAVRDYSQALRLKPDYIQALIGRGRTWLEWGQSAPARKDFEAALALDKKNGAATAGMADYWIKQGEFEEAYYTINSFRYVVPRGFYLLAWLSMKLGKPDRALYEIEMSPKSEQNSSEYWRLYGEIRCALENWEIALSSLNRAIEFAPHNLAARKLRVRCYIKLDMLLAATDEGRAIRRYDEAKGAIEMARVLVAGGQPQDLKSAILYLVEAKDAGVALDGLTEDPDFKALKDDPEFKKLTGE